MTMFILNDPVCPYSMKSAAAPKQEQYRLQVEEAEDKLVQMTETAIGLMKAVLENVSLGTWRWRVSQVPSR